MKKVWRIAGFMFLLGNGVCWTLGLLRWIFLPHTFNGIQFSLFLLNGVTVAMILWVMGWADQPPA